VTGLSGRRSAMPPARGRLARWLLVIGLLVGIAAMHVLSCSMDSDDPPAGSRVDHAVTAAASRAAPAQATAGVLPASAWWSDATGLTEACGLCCARPAAMCLAVLTIGLVGLGATRWTARAVPPGTAAGGRPAATRAGLTGGPPSGLLAHGTLLRV
jgi:hypothetical protein